MLSREVVWKHRCIMASTLQHSGLSLDRRMVDILSGRVLPLHRSVTQTVRGLRIYIPTDSGRGRRYL